MTVEEMTKAANNLDKISDFEPTGLTRCDACSNGASKAYVRFIKGDFELMYCSHHSNVHELAMISSGWHMQDSRHVLQKEIEAYKKPSDDNF